MAERGRRKRLGEILVLAGALDETQLESALAEQAATGRKQRLGKLVVSMGMVTEEDIATSLADQLGYATVDLAEFAAEPAALSRVPRALAERHQALPLRVEEGDVLLVAMCDPTNVVALDDLRLTSGMRAVRPVVATTTAVESALLRLYGADTGALDLEDLDNAVTAVEDEEDDLSTLTKGAGEQPVVRLANAILADAVRSRTSDVHIEPMRTAVRVRYRVDGLLREKMRIPRHIAPALISRMKIISQLDISERRLPQDGRAVIRVEGQEVDLRVSTMPGLNGETIVMRLLRKGEQRMDVAHLGMAEADQEQFEQVLSRPQGLIIITGPTGSGKTSTLYAGLEEITDEIRNIITLEDPIEYELDGVNQTQVQPKIGFTFARGMRSVLRQDPDVVMVGEIRDGETAELAMEASFTGHLVLTTLHTNDAPASIIRLVDLGVERFMIASSVMLVVAQRLVRRICHHCAEPIEPDQKETRLLGIARKHIAKHQLLMGSGCQLCDETGYLGRLAVYEMLRISPNIRDMIVGGASESEIGAAARQEGMKTLREDALAKALAGVTTLSEVLRVTPDSKIDMERVDPNATPLSSLADPEVAISAVPTIADEGQEPAKGKRAGKPTVAPTAITDTSRLVSREEDEDDRKLLVVDDDPSVLELVGLLMMDDYTVLEAADGSSAIALATKFRPEAMILDLNLPDINGVDVVRKLRANPATSKIAVLMITGAEDPAAEVEGLLAGVDDYLTKPFDEEVLRMRLRAAILRRAGIEVDL